MKTLQKCLRTLSEVASKVEWLPALLSRLVLGWVFASSGWGKLHQLDKVTEFFRSIGVPLAQVQAPFVAFTELACGVLLLAGFYTRAAALPLIVIMGVAIRTARWDDVSGLGSLTDINEFLYLVMLLGLAIHGGGRIAADAILGKSRR